jgi:hypothetical protein
MPRRTFAVLAVSAVMTVTAACGGGGAKVQAYDAAAP